MLDVMVKRRTSKVIGDTDKPVLSAGFTTEVLEKLLTAAGNAPFHYACDRLHHADMPSPVPWRVYSLSDKQCQKLMEWMIRSGDATKIPNMLAAACGLLQVTWLPDEGTIKGDVTAKDAPVFDGTLRNMEHIAAASAFVQSLLLAADAQGFRTYWSSGGPLRGGEVFSLLGIPDTQLLIGSVFLFPADPKDADVRPGALANARGEVSDWSRIVEIPV